MNAREHEVGMLKKSVGGLQEDNDRINRMYQVAEREAFVDRSFREGSAMNIHQQEN